jgi:hypothetical protein
MKQGNNKKWFHYIKDIISSDLYSAVLLVTYLRQAAKYKTYVSALEVMEADKYLQEAINVKLVNMPTAFVVGKN